MTAPHDSATGSAPGAPDIQPLSREETAARLRRRAEARLTPTASPTPASPTPTSPVPDPLAPAAAERLIHELQVHQIELELQNDELLRTQEALETARARYFDLYELAPIGYLTLTDDGMIREANLAAATLFDVPRGAPWPACP